MATTQSKEFIIEFKGKQGDLPGQIRELRTLFRSLDAEVVSGFSKVDEKTKKVSSSVKILTKNAEELKKVLAESAKALEFWSVDSKGNAVKKTGVTSVLGTPENEVKARKDLEKEAEKTRKALQKAREQARQDAASDFVRTTREQRDAALRDIALQESIRTTGANSAKTQLLQVQEADIAARKAYAQRVAEIERDIARGTSTLRGPRGFISRAEALRQALTTQQAELTLLEQRRSTLHSLAAAERELANAERLRAELQNRADARRSNSFIGRLISAGSATPRPPTPSSADSVTRLRETQNLVEWLTRANAATQEVGRSHTNWVLRVIELIGLYRVFNFVLNSALSAIKNIPHSGIKLEGVTASLTASTGNLTLASKQLNFLDQLARKSGQSIDALRQSYQRFAASALLAGEAQSTVNKIFSNVTTVATTLHLSQDQVDSVFLAFSQMFNKRKVQAEELVKQLAQNLPGVVNQAAIALEKKGLVKSAADLGVQMKKGLIPAHETVLLLTEELANVFGGEAFAAATKGLNSEIGRLETAWTHLSENLYKASAKQLVSVLRFTSGAIDGLSDFANNTAAVEVSLNNLESSIGNLVMAGGAFITMLRLVKAESLSLSASLATARAAGVGLWAILKQNAAGIGFGSLIAGIFLIKDALDAVANRASFVKQSIEDLETAAKAKKEREAAERGEPTSFRWTVENDPTVKGLRELEQQADQAWGEAIAKARLNPANYLPEARGMKVVQRDPMDDPGVKEAQAKWKKIGLLLQEARAEAFKAAGKDVQETVGTAGDDDSLGTVNQWNTKASLIKQAIDQLEQQSQVKVKAIQLEKETYQGLINTKNAQDQVVSKAESLRKLREFDNRIQAEQNKLLKEKLTLEKQAQVASLSGLNSEITDRQKMLRVLEAIESSGNPAAVSKKGAVSRLQVMPATMRDPGIGGLKGISPNASEPEIAEFGRKYFLAILDETKKVFGRDDPLRAVAMYHSGIGLLNNPTFLKEDWFKVLGPEGRGEVTKFLQGYTGKTAELVDLNKANTAEVKFTADALEQRVAAVTREQAYLAETARIQQQVKETNEQLEAELLTSKGRTFEAEALRINQQFAKRILEAKNSENFAGVQTLEILKKQALANLKIEEAKIASDKAMTGLQNKEQKLLLDKQLGLISEVNAVGKLIEARKEALKQAEAYLKVLKEAARLNPDNRGLGEQVREQQNSMDAIRFSGLGQNRASVTWGPIANRDTALASANLGREADLAYADSLPNTDDRLKEKQKAENAFRAASFKANAEYYGAIAGVAETSFGNITKAMVKMYGAQSTQAKIAFGLQKASMAAQVVMTTALSVQNMMTLQPPQLAWVMAGLAAASGAAQLAVIMSETLPQAHSGLTKAESTGTYLIKRGERVLAEEQNRDFTAYMKRTTSAKQEKPTTTVVKPTPVKSVIYLDLQQAMREFMASSDGEQITMTHVRASNY